MANEGEKAKALDPVLKAITDLENSIKSAKLTKADDQLRRTRALAVLDSVSVILKSVCEAAEARAGYYCFEFPSE
jgi:hypothetical protein